LFVFREFVPRETNSVLRISISPLPALPPLVEEAHVNAPQLMLAADAPFEGSWSLSSSVRIGRIPGMDLVLDDASVSRHHAEIVLAEDGWHVRDNGSTNGTHLNGVRLGRTPQRLRAGDVVGVGKIALRVKSVVAEPVIVRMSGGRAVQVEALSERSWAEAVDGLHLDDHRWKVDGKAFLSLMRAGYQLAHSTTPEMQLQKALDEAVDFFGASRGAIFLQDESSGKLEPRCTSARGRRQVSRLISRSPSVRAFTARQSLLFQDCRETPEFSSVESVAHSTMKSLICAVLRSPDRAFGVLHLDRDLLQEPFTEEDLQLAESLAAALALGLERLQMVERQQELFLHTVTALAQAVEMRDLYTGNHTHRVTVYASLLAEELGLGADERRVLRAAAALHDIGKIAIDDSILRKPGRLSESEFDRMKTHVIRGSEIIQMVPGLSWALPVVRGHHERWDGTGYPDRLAGEAIPLLARVVGVADAFDAMTSDRPYRSGMAVGAAYGELEAGSGRHFDPRCVEAFVRIRPQIEAILEREKAYRDEATIGVDTVTAQKLREQTSIETPRPVAMTTFLPVVEELATSSIAMDD
jgi:HD-GYP domain-containing protein (c-di-GMP phosphodiesterase class II)